MISKKKKGLHRNCKGFFGRNRKFKQKKRSSSQKRHKIWCQSTKNTNLYLDLLTRSPEPVYFFRGTVLVWGGTIFVWGSTSSQLGGHGPGMPPVAPGKYSFADACDTAGMKISTAKTVVLHLSRNPDWSNTEAGREVQVSWGCIYERRKARRRIGCPNWQG